MTLILLGAVIGTVVAFLEGYDKDTFQYYMIDGFIVSKNITVNSVETLNLGFKNTDYNPVQMKISLN